MGSDAKTQDFYRFEIHKLKKLCNVAIDLVCMKFNNYYQHLSDDENGLKT